MLRLKIDTEILLTNTSNINCEKHVLIVKLSCAVYEFTEIVGRRKTISSVKCADSDAGRNRSLLTLKISMTELETEMDLV